MYNFLVKKLKCTETDSLLIPYFKDKTNIPNEEVSSKIDMLKKQGKFNGEFGEVFNITRKTEKGNQDIILLGLGKEDDLDIDKIIKAFSLAIDSIKNLKSNSVFLRFDLLESIGLERTLKAMIEGLNLGKSLNTYENNQITICVGGHNLKKEDIPLCEKVIKEYANY